MRRRFNMADKMDKRAKELKNENLPELKNMAETLGVDYKSDVLKDDLIDLILEKEFEAEKEEAPEEEVNVEETEEKAKDSYRALINFFDKEDEKHFYSVGDIYPRKGLEPSAERIKELMGNKNDLGRPVIE